MGIITRKIEINFQEALQQAQDMDDLADRLEKVGTVQIENHLQLLSASWKGSNADYFVRKQGLLQGNIQRTASDIRNIALRTRRIAKKFHDAEIKGVEIFLGRWA